MSPFLCSPFHHGRVRRGLGRLACLALLSLAAAIPGSVMAQTGHKTASKATKADGGVGGTWAGTLAIEIWNPGDAEPEARTYHAWLMLWPKSHLWWYEYISSVSSFQASVGGRWRLSGDTLWLGENHSYTTSKLQLTNTVFREAMTSREFHDSTGSTVNGGEFLPGVLDTVDTLHWRRYPANDSLFWSSDTTLKKVGDRTTVSAYKVSVSNGRMTLVRLDAVSYKPPDPSNDESLLSKSKKFVLRRATAPISWPSLPAGWP